MSRFFLFIILLLTQISSFAQSTNTDFYGRVVDKSKLCSEANSFMSEQDIERLISQMLAMQGLKNRFIVVGCQSITNCIATVDKDKRPVILFNPSFLKKVEKLQFSESIIPNVREQDWTTLTILAHELGHHMNNHITNPLPDATAYDKELEADETAGFFLYLMGGTLEHGKNAFSDVSEIGSYTHPPRARRYEALEKGYRDAEKRYHGNREIKKIEPVYVNPSSNKIVSGFPFVKIADQNWMSENLNVSSFQNGDEIPQAKTVEELNSFSEAREPAWCYYNFDPKNGKIYGRMYNGFAIMDPRGLAPRGWRIPSKTDFERLVDYLGGNYEDNYMHIKHKVAAVKLKSKTGWIDGNNGTNSSGFYALPGGTAILKQKNPFHDIGVDADFFSTTADTPEMGFIFHQTLSFGPKPYRLFKGGDKNQEINYEYTYKNILLGVGKYIGTYFYVRCIED